MAQYIPCPNHDEFDPGCPTCITIPDEQEALYNEFLEKPLGRIIPDDEDITENPGDGKQK